MTKCTEILDRLYQGCDRRDRDSPKMLMGYPLLSKEILSEAERLGCKDRLAVLEAEAPVAAELGLDGDYFRRLALLRAELVSRGNRGPRRPERDDRIRFYFRCLRDSDLAPRGGPYTYEKALQITASHFGLSESAIETMIGRPMSNPDGFPPKT